MENMMNNQGKRKQQYKDSARFTWYGFLGALLLAICLTLCGCYGTYYISDAEYSDLRESHASLTYYQGNIYWGWSSGYYYYYGKPHYYPWYYYYNTCPPSHYTTTTHVIVTRPVNRPTHRPKVNTHRSNIRVKTNVNRNTNVKTNINRNKVIIKNNRSNNSNKRSKNTRRRPK